MTNQSDWIEWSGGEECPVPPTTMVQIRYRDGKGEDWTPMPAVCWSNQDVTEDAWFGDGESDADIIAYRIVKP